LTSIRIAEIAGYNRASAVSGGGYLKLDAVGIYSDKRSVAITDQVTWQSSNSAVTVHRDGLAVTDQAPDSAMITATHKDIGISATLVIEVPPADFAQVLREITLGPAAPSIEGGGSLQLTATGVYADGTPRDLSEVVRWDSSDPAIAVDAKGRASARPVTASATITATDPDTGLSAAIDVSVAPPQGSPALLRVAVEPEDATIDAGGELQFTASGVFDQGPSQDLTRVVDWSSDNPAIAIDGTGKASAQPQSAAATITATERLSGLRGTAKATISPPQERRLQTPFGEFAYWLHAEPAVKPLLEEASSAYLTVEPMDDKVTASYNALLNARSKVPEPATIKAEIEQFTDRNTSADAAQAAGAKILADSLKQDFEHLQAEYETIQQDMATDKDEVERVGTEKLRDEYKAKAAEVDAKWYFVIESAKNVVKAAMKDPGAVIDQVALSLEILEKENNEWTQKAQEAEQKARELNLKDATAKYNTAIARFDEIKKYIASKKDTVDAAKGHSQGKWEKTEYWYDSTADQNRVGKFRFYNLREAIRAAKLAAGLAAPAHDAIEIARVAAEKLGKFGKSPEYWMADVAEDGKIVAAWIDATRKMSEQSREKADFATWSVRDYQQTFKDARDAMDHTLGSGAKSGKMPKDDLE
jgi:hypothetical protein